MRHNGLFALFCVLLLMSGLSNRTAVAKELHVIAVGINAYENLPSLKAAQEDAIQVARLFHSTGAASVRLLLNKDATLDSLSATWTNAIEEASAGDHLVFYFAGHGTTEPEHLKASEPDRLDETLLLTGFEPDVAQTERLPDDLLHQWLKLANEKNLSVTLLLDTSFHKAKREIPGLPSRGLTLRNIEWQPHPQLVQSQSGDRLLDGIQYITGAIKGDSLFEFDQESRLGSSLVSALVSVLDCTPGSSISYNNFAFSLYQGVFEAVESHQHLSIHPQTADIQNFLACTSPAETKLLEEVSLSSDSSKLPELAGVQTVNSFVTSDYHWLSKSGLLMDKKGTIVAKIASPEDVQSALAHYLERVELATTENASDLIGLSPSRSSYRAGDELAIQMRFPENTINSVIHINSQGHASFLVNSRTSYDTLIEELKVSVTKPFGNETLVQISSSLEMPDKKMWSEIHRDELTLSTLLEKLDRIKSNTIQIDVKTILTLEKP